MLQVRLAAIAFSTGAFALAAPLGGMHALVGAETTILGREAEVMIPIRLRREVRAVPPGAVGWGFQWKRESLWPSPPADFDDAGHARWIKTFAEKNRSLVRSADLRHVSWPWGVSFSTFGVNWENSAGPWSKRPKECVLGSGWCEKTVVGVNDLLAIAEVWELEAVTVAVPLAVFDGAKKRWGPRLLWDDLTDADIEKIADHAARLADTLRRHKAYKKLQRVYLAAGCEWRRYAFDASAKTYAKLVRRMREKIHDDNIWIVACASDSADIPGAKRLEAAKWNRLVYEGLHDLKGVALDLHRYRGMLEQERTKEGLTAMTPANIDRLLQVGVSQRDYLHVHPAQWGGRGPAMPSVLLENGIHGVLADHKKRSTAPHPWVVDMAYADLLREALASESLAFLGWTWFAEDIPYEWPHGAAREGALLPQARLQAFLSEYHRGSMLDAGPAHAAPIRGNATRGPDGVVRAYGGNFSRAAHTLGFTFDRGGVRVTQIEVLTEKGGVAKIEWDGKSPLRLAPQSLWRATFADP